MGLKLNYELASTTMNIHEVREVVRKMYQKAKSMPFEHISDILDETEPPSKKLSIFELALTSGLKMHCGRMIAYRGSYHYVRPLHTVAFSVYPGAGTESAVFGLATYPRFFEVIDQSTTPPTKRKAPTNAPRWAMDSFCDTQYSSNPQYGGIPNFIRCHLMMIEMLDFAKELGICKRVVDDGGYWEGRDTEALATKVGEINRLIAGLVGQIKDMFQTVGGVTTSGIGKFPNFEQLEHEGVEEIKKKNKESRGD